jgi:hypothetical protein
MIEIAIASMRAALAANGDEAPEGSWDPQSVPIPDAGELAKDVEARLNAEEEAAQAASESDSPRIAAEPAAVGADETPTASGNRDAAADA